MQDTYAPGTMVLVRNSATERELDKKSKPRYLGPYQVVRLRTGGHSYVLQELDGTVWKQAVAAFRIIPYVPRQDKRLRRLKDNLSETSDNSSSDSKDTTSNTSTDDM